MHGLSTGLSSGSGDVSGLLQDAHFGGSSCAAGGWDGVDCGADSDEVDVDVSWVPVYPWSVGKAFVKLRKGCHHH